LRTITHKILSFIVGFILIIIVVELFLKWSEIKLPYKTLDSKIGKTYQPNVLINEQKEGFYMGKTNSYGFIGNVDKKRNTFRIALLGDSFTEGFQVFEPYKFSRILEQSLNANSKLKIQVLNFGISNVVLSETYIRKKRLAEQFDIDLFIYVFDNYNIFYPQEGILNSVTLTQKKDTLLIVENTSKTYELYKKIQPLIDQSSYLNFVFDGYLLLQRGQAYPKLFDKFYIANSTNDIIDFTDYSNNSLSDLSLKIIYEMGKEKTIFVFRESAEKSLKSKIESYNIPVIETAEVLDSLRKKDIDPYYWESTQTYGHFNYEANKVFGEYISKKIAPFIKNR